MKAIYNDGLTSVTIEGSKSKGYRVTALQSGETLLDRTTINMEDATRLFLQYVRDELACFDVANERIEIK